MQMRVEFQVREWMTTQFIQLDEDMSLMSALSALQTASGCAGVIVNKDGKPQGLVLSEDLEHAASSAGTSGTNLSLMEARRWLPPLILVDGTLILTRVLQSTEEMSFIAHGARGMVVRQGKMVVGVLLHSHKPTFQLAGSHYVQLTGDIGLSVTPVICKRCGTSNKLAFLDPDNVPQCVNKQKPDPGLHQLELGWL